MDYGGRLMLKIVTAYDINGEEIDTTRELSFAEVRNNNDVTQYLISTYRYEPFNPTGTDAHKTGGSDTTLQQVPESLFNFYVLFLRTKNLAYFHKVRRGMLDK
jgi:hypothetical protein